MAKVIGPALFIAANVVSGGSFAWAAPYLLGAGIAVSIYQQKSAARKAARNARDAYNAGLTDRMQMVDLRPDAPRTLALGRVRAVEGIRRRWASGAHEEKLTLIVSFAGHEIDGFETFYFNDTELALDGSGWVQTAPYMKGRTDSYVGPVFTGATYIIAGQQFYPGGAHENLADSVHAVTSSDLDYAGASDGAPEVVDCAFTLTASGFGISTLVTLTSPRAESRMDCCTRSGTFCAAGRTGTEALAERSPTITAGVHSAMLLRTSGARGGLTKGLRARLIGPPEAVGSACSRTARHRLRGGRGRSF